MPRLIHCPQCNADITTFLRPGERVVCKRCDYEVVVPADAPAAPLEAARANPQSVRESPDATLDPVERELERLAQLGRLSSPTAGMYTLPAIGVGTFFGGILGGAILASKNYAALGDEDAARRAIWYGIGGTVVLMAILMVIPENVRVPSFAVHMTQIAAVTAIAQQTQGARIAAHRQLGGEIHSKWRAAGIGLLYGLLQLAVILGVAASVAMLLPAE